MIEPYARTIEFNCQFSAERMLARMPALIWRRVESTILTG
jgi:hypothetical protein